MMNRRSFLGNLTRTAAGLLIFEEPIKRIFAFPVNPLGPSFAWDDRSPPLFITGDVYAKILRSVYDPLISAFKAETELLKLFEGSDFGGTLDAPQWGGRYIETGHYFQLPNGIRGRI